MRTIAPRARAAFLSAFAASLACSAADLPSARTMVANSRELSPLPPIVDVDRPLVVPLQADPPGPIPLAGFDAIWFDYVPENGVPPCRLDFDFDLTLRPLSEPRHAPSAVAAFTAQPPWVVLASSKPDPHTWKPKDLWYLVGRFFDTAPDGEWRFTHGAGNDLVVQRRWRRDMRGVEAIDLAVEGPSLPSQVNLVVESGGLGSKVQAFGGIAADSRLEDGRAGVRLHVQGGGDSPFVLKEIIVFFPADGRHPAPRNPVTEVSLLGRGARAGTALLIGPLPKQVQTVAPGHERVVMALDPLTTGSDAVLLQARLTIRPLAAQGRCALRPERARLVNTYTRRLWDPRSPRQ